MPLGQREYLAGTYIPGGILAPPFPAQSLGEAQSAPERFLRRAIRVCPWAPGSWSAAGDGHLLLGLIHCGGWGSYRAILTGSSSLFSAQDTWGGQETGTGVESPVW